MVKFLRKYTLPISILLGGMGYKWFWYLDFLTPYLIFLMLFLTFSKINFSNICFSWLHFWLILLQIVMSICLFWVLKGININVAQGLMICVFCPTATAAAVITQKLNGNIEFVASYTLFVNIIMAVFIPLIYPLINNMGVDMDFMTLFVKILGMIFPLLIFPFILATVFRKIPVISNIIIKNSGMAFYVWSVSLIIVISRITKYFIEEDHNGIITLFLCIGSLIICLIQFFLGKIIGRPFGQIIAAGQSLGQKNTIFAIWLANTYFNPVVAVGAGAYIVWQTIFNSIQIYWIERRQDKSLKYTVLQ